MAWYDEAVFYHIYPLGLLDAPKENSYTKPVHRLRELDRWIEYYKQLGINAIYIGPLFESVGHGYETTDYKKLDSRLGDNDDLKHFVGNCHKNGIRVIFDGVFNHVGRDFFAFKDLKDNRENSRYRDWFLNVNFWGNNEYNDGFSYENWGGYNLLVKLNQRNPEVKDFIADVIRFWVSEFDIDGIRLDAADVLDFDFMKMLRSVSNEVKTDFWLMGEVIHGDYTRWVNDGTLHSVTNYTLHKALYSGHNDHNYFEIAHTVKRLYEMGGNRPDGLKLYNFSDNHDVERIINKLNNRNNYYPVHILVYTLPGVPSIYYGSEFGIEGRKEKGSDASLRPALSYDDYKDAIGTNPYTSFIARLSEIRRCSKVLSYGDYKEIKLTNRQYLFSRNLENESVIVAVNNDENPSTIEGNGVRDGKYIGAISGQSLVVNNGHISVRLGANSGEIFISLDTMNTFRLTSKAIEPEVKTVEAFEENSDLGNKDEGIGTVTDSNTVSDNVSAYDAVADNTVDDKNISDNTVSDDTVSVNNNSTDKGIATKDSIADASDGDAQTMKLKNGIASKYSIDSKYDLVDVDSIKNRTDYENMTVEEIQVLILEKMSGNGYIDSQMIKSVMDNEHLGSLINWIKSFR